MNLINATKMMAGYTLGLDKEGRESLVVVVKGTFLIPSSPTSEPKLAPKQVPLVTADEFTGEPGFSAPLYESDYAPHKPRCDVLLNGSAYAPGGRPAERVTVTLRVGTLTKSFDVVGKRTWGGSILGWKASRVQPFTVQPISYDLAFGGIDRSNPDPSKHRAYLSNPFGVGYHDTLDANSIEGKPLPNTQEKGTPVTSPTGKYTPVAFGPVARVFPERVKWAGTYDQKWQDNVFPFLPADFDNRYFQCAPEDQQLAYLVGGEHVELINLSLEAHATFKLPRVDVPVEFNRSGSTETKQAVCDTLFLKPDENRFVLVWRASIPLKRNMFEVYQVVVGRMPRGWYRARSSGKEYYSSLAGLVNSKKGLE